MTATPHRKINGLTYAGKHASKLIESLDSIDEPEMLGIAMGLRKSIADLIQELTDRLPASSGIRQAGQLYGPKGDA